MCRDVMVILLVIGLVDGALILVGDGMVVVSVIGVVISDVIDVITLIVMSIMIDAVLSVVCWSSMTRRSVSVSLAAIVGVVIRVGLKWDKN